MTGGSLLLDPPAAALPESPSRSWVLVSIASVLVLIVVGASVAAAGIRLESQSKQVGFFRGSVSGVLYYGHSQVTFGYEQNFIAPPASGPGALVKVGMVAWMGLDCGNSTYEIGAVDNCTIDLNSNPPGLSPSVHYWSKSFSGYTAWNISLLPPGAYALSIYVHAGFPPLPDLIVPFGVTVEIVTLD
jgi:hypothetical protein